MAAVNFPNSPVDGDTFTYEGKTFTWDNTKSIWVRNPAGPIPVIEVTAAPVISGVITAAELTEVVLTIDNDDATAIYIPATSGGSFVRSTNTITWTLPAVTADEIYSLLIYASKAGVGISSTTQYDILVTNEFINTQADTSIIIGAFGPDSSSIDWEF
jgi:formylmethanofuran dehydrogenase subunit A